MPFSWIAGQACKQQKDTSDSAVNSLLLCWPDRLRLVKGHGEKQSHSYGSRMLVRVAVEIRLAASETFNGGSDACPADLLRHFSESLP